MCMLKSNFMVFGSLFVQGLSKKHVMLLGIFVETIFKLRILIIFIDILFSRLFFLPVHDLF